MDAQQKPLLKTLLDCSPPAAAGTLPQPLRDMYDGDLRFPEASAERPYIVANFVSTLDGTASYKLPGESSGSTISGSDASDRFVMGLLRASADAVMIGANTLHDTSPEGLWTPAETYPGAKELLADYRGVLGKAAYPLVVIVTASGRLDLTRAVFQAPELRVLIITTAAGEKELLHRGAHRVPSLQIAARPAAAGIIGAEDILHLLMTKFGIRFLLHEGGPTLLGRFLAHGALDELFLTVAPQIAGHLPQSIRPSIVEAVEFLPETAPWFDLLSVKQHAQHVYLRYRYIGARR